MVDNQKSMLLGIGIMLFVASFGFLVGAGVSQKEFEATPEKDPIVVKPLLVEPEKHAEPEVLLAIQEIDSLNGRASNSDAYIDIFDLTPEKIDTILSDCFTWPKSALAKENLSPVSAEEKSGILANATLQKNYGYGLILTRGSLRALPTMNKYVNPNKNPGFDRLQLSAIYPQEPVFVFGTSKDGKYLLVASDYYAGWILKEHVANISKEKLESLLNRENFIVVQDNRVEALRVSQSGARKRIELPMGTVVPLADAQDTTAFSSLLSSGCFHGLTYDGQGELAILEVDKNAVVSLGYLPFTQDTITKQADKLLGEAYDWGGADQGRDCSAMVRDIYSGFGLWIPRDSGPQALYAKELGGLRSIRFDEGLTDSAKLRKISNLPVGSLLFMPGHVMMVYKQEESQVLVIHDYVEYYKVNGSNLERVEVMQVGVSDLEILDRNGQTYLSSIFGALSLEEGK